MPFFLSAPATHPHLHSFPTRRSSDLGAPLQIGVPVRRPLDVHALELRDTAERPQVIGLIGQRDRKSTRLNSSHRCISYAVFCLKKKKTAMCCSHWAQHAGGDDHTVQD